MWPDQKLPSNLFCVKETLIGSKYIFKKKISCNSIALKIKIEACILLCSNFNQTAVLMFNCVLTGKALIRFETLTLHRHFITWWGDSALQKHAKAMFFIVMYTWSSLFLFLCKIPVRIDSYFNGAKNQKGFAKIVFMEVWVLMTKTSNLFCGKSLFLLISVSISLSLHGMQIKIWTKCRPWVTQAKSSLWFLPDGWPTQSGTGRPHEKAEGKETKSLVESHTVREIVS